MFQIIRHRLLPLLARLLCMQVFCAPALAMALAAQPDPQPVWLLVELNGQIVGTERLLRLEQQIWIDAEQVAQWRLAVPAVAAWQDYADGRHIRLDALAGLEYQLDDSSGMLRLSATAQALQHNHVQAQQHDRALPQRAATGSFLNYDLSLGLGRASSLGGSFELGLFGPLGYATTTFLAGDSVFGDANLMRLESAWTRDDPDRLRTLTVGDAISSGGSFGVARRFAGVQWGSNFALQPDLITFPLPSASGSARVPSTVDVYVDHVLRLRQDVPAGPFELSGLPVTTGAGLTEMVITDALGRQQRLPYSFYTSAELLRPGLRSWQYSAGVQRERFGQRSIDYGQALVSGSERYGFSDSLTGEWHGEWTPQQVRTGLGITWQLARLGIAQLHAAGSHADQGSGSFAAAGFERRARSLSYSSRLAWSSAGFDAAAVPGERTPRRRLQTALGWSLGEHGSLSLSWLAQERHTGQQVRLARLGYSRNVGRIGFLNASVQRVFGTENEWSIALGFTVPLGDSASASTSYGRDQDQSYVRSDLQRSPPAGEGYGYRVLLEPGSARRLDAGVVYQGNAGVLSAELSTFKHQTQGRLQASGGLLWLGGQLHASRPLTESFALVQADTFPDVRVYADNQWVATTDRHGLALIPRLRPWQSNELRIEQADLPLDASVDQLSMIAVPPARSGLKLDFAVQAQRSAVIRIVLEDGLPLPAGAQVVLQPGGRQLPLGLAGLIYADGLAAFGNELHLSWRDQVCVIRLDLPADTHLQPDLGVLPCPGVQR
ncbi:MAG: fimbria/pilus outer membrane usher protein [Pseudomarimonas sp.]